MIPYQELRDKFALSVNKEDPILSFSSLKTIDPGAGGTPRDFMLYFEQSKTEKLDNLSKAFLHYLFKDRTGAQFRIVKALNTTEGKLQRDEAVKASQPFVRETDFNSFPRMLECIQYLDVFDDVMTAQYTKCLQMDVVEFKHPHTRKIYKIRRYRHILNEVSNTIAVIKIGDFGADVSRYTLERNQINLQAAIYALGLESPQVYVFTVNKAGNENCFKLSEESLRKGYNKLVTLLNVYERIKSDGKWHKSHDYHTQNGYIEL